MMWTVVTTYSDNLDPVITLVPTGGAGGQQTGQSNVDHEVLQREAVASHQDGREHRYVVVQGQVSNLEQTSPLCFPHSSPSFLSPSPATSLGFTTFG